MFLIGLDLITNYFQSVLPFPKNYVKFKTYSLLYYINIQMVCNLDYQVFIDIHRVVIVTF